MKWFTIIRALLPYIYKGVKLLIKNFYIMLGIDTLKKAVLKIVKFGNELGAGLEDGKLKFGEITGLIDNVIGFAFIFNNWSDIEAEFNDLDAAEKTVLIEYIKFNLNLPDDKVETIIEAGLQWATETAAFIKTFK